MASSLRIDGLRAGYGSVRVIHDLSLRVGEGETVALLGTNGNGKSTLMHCIMGVVRPGAGRIVAKLDGIEHDLAGNMSGGEQQMLALARALMTAPKILLVDEPSVGLAPLLVAQVIAKIEELKRRIGLTVLMAEQNLAQAIRIADRGYVIVHGRIEFEGGSREELEQNDLVKRLYLGL